MRIKTYREVKDIPVDGDVSLLDVLRLAGVEIDAPCGGGGTCGKCRVRIARDGAEEDVLACMTAAADDMEVTIGERGSFLISLDGTQILRGYDIDGGEGFGAAIDVGTTTLVCRVCDLSSGDILASAGAANPQSLYGADVISRISAAQEGHLSDLEGLVNDALAELVRATCKAAGITPQQITSAVLTGNTVIEHLVCGVDPTPIGVAPYTPSELFGTYRSIDCLAQSGCSHESAFVSPCVAGFVGGDVVCDMLADGMGSDASVKLLVDLGTNGEMALSCSNGLFCCATAAGPVFEGANITFGMPAFEGAIYEVAYDGADISVKTLGGVPARGICGTGLIDAVAVMLRLGVLDETGYLLDADEAREDAGVSEAVADRLGEFEGIPAFRLTSDIVITQKDIRNVQLAKAAIFAGISVMMSVAGIDYGDVDDFAVAGGFTVHLNLENAATVGLFSPELLPRARGVGNAAIEGATSALVSTEARLRLQKIAKTCGYIELSTSRTFQERYVDAMYFDGPDD